MKKLGLLIALAEQLSSVDLGEFFDGWLCSPEMPPIPEIGLNE